MADVSILAEENQCDLELGESTPSAAEDPSASSGQSIELAMQAQEQTEWCWAAVSTSVALMFDGESKWRQCLLVNEELEQTKACVDGSSEECNQPWYLCDALRRVEHYEADQPGRPFLEEIAAEIAAGKPIGVLIGWHGGGGHFVAIDGCDLARGTIDVKDPWWGHTYIDYESFPQHYQGGGTWDWTYRIAKPGELS